MSDGVRRTEGETPAARGLAERALIDSPICGIVVADLSGRVLDANDEFLRITGYARDDVAAGRFDWRALIPPDQAAKVAGVIDEIQRTGRHAPYETEYVRKDGSRVAVLVGTAPARDGGPEGTGVGFVLDLSPHRALQDAVRRSEDQFKRFIEQSPLPTIIASPDGRIAHANPAWLRMFDATIEQTVWYNVFADPQIQAHGLMPQIERGFRVEPTVIPPFRYVAPGGGKTGQVMWLGALVYPVKDAAGRVEQVIIVEQDVTEQRQAQEQVRAALDRLTFVLDAAGLGDWSWDAATDLVTLSPRAAEFLGAPPGTHLTREQLSQRVDPEDHARARAAVNAATARGDDYEVEYRVLGTGSGGADRWIVARGRAAYDAAGAITGMAGVLADATARHRADQLLRDAEERLRLGLLAGNTGTWDWDVATGRVTWSDILYDFHGVDRDAFPGTVEFFAQLVHPDDRDRVGAAIEQALATGEPYAVEFRIIHGKTGEVHWLATQGRVTRDAAGRPVRMLGATSDVTARKRAEHERDRLLESERAARALAERALAQAEAAGRTKDEFLATLSHELRTPLSAILGYAQLLLAGGAAGNPEELAHGLGVIERNARAQAQIIEDLLDMSRIVAGKVRLEARPVDLRDVVRAAVDTVTPTADAKGVRLVADVPDAYTDRVSVWGDPARLQQVLWNLLANAVKFTPRDGTVTAAVAVGADGDAVVTVADTGSGIDSAFLPHVFDRFRQADASTTRRHGGLGLGLSIVKQLVEMHGGTIGAQSGGADRGSTFVVRLPPYLGRPPAAEPAAAAAAVSAPAPGPEPAARLAGLRVLVVDDEPDARHLVVHVLTARGAAVVAVPSAHAALALLGARPFDLLVSDIGMPDLDGYELVQRLRATTGDAHGNARIPAIALTAFARTEDRTRALLAGFQLHLPKPVETPELLAAVGAVIAAPVAR
ncbi:MAG TPA: PAS domain-containing protein [Tepidisphaeraceae bacterium]|nr:PAS domain-containing protein [Tepidisphaeraceae bacterium]